MNTFPKTEKLCGSIKIANLHRLGKHFTAWPLRVTFLPSSDTQIVIWAPKKLFKHAVDRNHLRRLMREAWRLNKSQLQVSACIALDYVDANPQSFIAIQKAVVKAINKINETHFA